MERKGDYYLVSDFTTKHPNDYVISKEAYQELTPDDKLPIIGIGTKSEMEKKLKDLQNPKPKEKE